MAELKGKGVSFDEHIPVGAMIEIPSAALAAYELAKKVDFFSIGTNDLIQYFVAADRINERVAYLYEPLNPTVLRLVKSIIDAGHRAGIWVSLCGEMASDPLAVLVLLGLGLDEFSVGAISIPQVKNTIRSVKFEDAKRLADGALSLSTAKEVERFIRRRMGRILTSQRG
jgi:phosphotransferase system enzyme I (PtsI)